MAEAFEIKGDRLTACYFREETVFVPEGIRIIGKAAFKGHTSIKKVLLPKSLERIEEHAFKGCRQLEMVSFPENLKFIGAYAFHRCHHLKEIKLPLGVSELLDCAFLYCDGLEQAILPGVQKMGKQAFVNATNLKKLVISSKLLPECISDTFTGCTRISEITIEENTYQTNDLIAIIEGSEEMPAIIHAIAADIYNMMDIYNHILTEFHVEPRLVELPEGIYEIGRSCFFDKRGIVKIELPKSLKRIKERAFRNCINLEHIVFKNENTKISEDAFKNCTNLKTVTLAGKVYSLTGLLEEKQKEENNSQVPELIQKIYQQLLGNFCISGTVLLRYWGKEERVTVPEGITIIAERAFAGNEAIGKLILPESMIEIQKEAFADCVLLQTLNFPKNLKKIGASAFEGCVKLLRAEIPKGITSLSPSVFSRCKKLGQVIYKGEMLKEIGQQAFYGCKSLSCLELPQSLEKIGAFAFYQCHSLKKVTIPKNVFSLGAEAFASCKGIKELMIEGTITIWGRNIIAYAEKLEKIVFLGEQELLPDYFAWKCTMLTQVIFPKTLKNIGLAALEGTAFLNGLSKPNIIGTIFLDGKEMTGDIKIPEGITAIAGGAFYGNHKITSIILPDSLQFLGKRAFCDCVALTEIKLPKQITVISKGVFAYCIGLKRVISENKIEKVEEKACYQCSSLVEFPSLYHAEIGDYAFSGCKAWKQKPSFCSFLGAYALEKTGCFKEQEVIVIGNIVVDGSRAEKEVIIPLEVHKIAPYAFYGNDKITKVVFPQGLKEIGEYAFCGCTELYEVVIPDSVEVIQDSAFEKCKKMVAFSSLAVFIGKRTFAFCKSLSFIKFPRVKEFFKETFLGCKIQTIEAKEIEIIGIACFKDCAYLEQGIWNKVKTVKEEAFAGCERLFSISFSSYVQIKEKAFLDCCRLVTLSFPCLCEFDSSAFQGSTFLEQIIIEGKTYSISGYQDLFKGKLPELVKRIYASAISCFYFQDIKTIAEYRSNAKAIRIPKGVEAVCGEVFKDCIYLEEIEIPESICYLGERAFWGSGWMEKRKRAEELVIRNHILLDGTAAKGRVSIPKEVHIISGWAFANGYGLKELVILNDKLVIEPHAFRNCIYLKSVTTADGNCYSMKGISVREDNSLPSVVRQIFEDALNCYKTDKNNVLVECTGNITNFALVKGITGIGNHVFQESNLLTYAVLTEEVTWIGEGAFLHCKWLTCLSKTKGVKEIGAMAFLGCIRLEKIEFSNCLRKIGKRAFENCTQLLEVVLPEGIKEIPNRAFFRCRSLKRLILPDSIEKIGEEAFAFCDSLEELVLPKGLIEIESRGFAWCPKLKIKEIPDKIKLTENVFEFSNITQKTFRKELCLEREADSEI